jgi:hypothetical protein
VFEKHRQKKEAAARHKAAADWQHERDETAELLEYVTSFHGEPSSEIVLKKGEALFAKVDGASLVEDRRGPGEFQGRSQGVSIPVGSLGGRSVRYHVGASRGHYVAGVPTPTAIDTGAVFVTNQRVIFRGQKQTRECLFSKLISCDHEDGESIFSVTNRQKNTTIHYGSELNGWFQARYAVAFANYAGTTQDLVREFTEELAALDAARPENSTPSAADG